MAEVRGNDNQKVIKGSAEKGHGTVHDQEMKPPAITKRALENAFEKVVNLAAYKSGLEKAMYSNELDLDTWNYLYSMMAKEAVPVSPAFEEINDQLVKHLSIGPIRLDTYAYVQYKREGEQGASGGGEGGLNLFKGDKKPEDEFEELRMKLDMLNIDEGDAPISRIRDFVKELGAKLKEVGKGIDQLQLKLISMVMDSPPADLRKLLEQGGDPHKVIVDYHTKKFFNPEEKSEAQATKLDSNSVDVSEVGNGDGI